jgi:hypothetical protein
MIIGLLLAAELSSALKTMAVAAWDDDFSGATAVVCENGRKSCVLTDQEKWGDFYAFFYEQGIYVPESFICTTGRGARFLTRNPSEIRRIDHLEIAVPGEGECRTPHTFYKLSAFAEAVESGIEDEEEFSSRMVDRLWKQVQGNTE